MVSHTKLKWRQIMSQNDATILELKKQIEEKKKELTAKFVPITNCSIELEGKRYNIHTFSDKNTIMDLMIKINALFMSAKQLGFEDEYTISGYSIKDWLKDLRSKLEVVTIKEKEKSLKVMESKLDGLLSEDKKTEIELKSIMDAMGSFK
jgi:hypothetical protein